MQNHPTGTGRSAHTEKMDNTPQSYPRFQVSILTRVIASCHNNAHRKLDRQVVSKENQI